MSRTARVLGWDVGGAYVKAAVVEDGAGGRAVRTASRPFEIWRDKLALPDVLRALAAELPSPASVAVTMTAELSDVFRTKREGVGFVLDAVEAVSRAPVRVFTTAGEFVDPAAARARPLDAAASNWVATAMLVGRFLPDALLVDVGSTTTDVIPVTGGRVAALGRTDPERLLAGELVYTGALRTNVAAIVRRVPLPGGECPVASELFALSGDAHVAARVARAGGLHVPDARRPAAHAGVRRRAARARGVRRRGDARRRRDPRHRGGGRGGPGRGDRRRPRPRRAPGRPAGARDRNRPRRLPGRAAPPSAPGCRSGTSPTSLPSTSARSPPPSPSPGSSSTRSDFDFQTFSGAAGSNWREVKV